MTIRHHLTASGNHDARDTDKMCKWISFKKINGTSNFGICPVPGTHTQVIITARRKRVIYEIIELCGWWQGQTDAGY